MRQINAIWQAHIKLVHTHGNEREIIKYSMIID